MLWCAGQCEYANFLMSLRNSRLFLIFVTGMLAVWNFACHDGDNLRDLEPPAIPRGVRSITGNNEITIEWFPNSEHDLAGYRIWKGSDEAHPNGLLCRHSTAGRSADGNKSEGVDFYL